MKVFEILVHTLGIFRVKRHIIIDISDRSLSQGEIGLNIIERDIPSIRIESAEVTKVIVIEYLSL